MGLLDDLKQEANKVLSEQEAAEARKRYLEELYRTSAKPLMLRVLGYLNELLEQLKIVQLEVPVAYDIPGIGQRDLNQDNHLVRLDSSENPQRIALHYECIAPTEERFTVTPLDTANEVRAFLQSQRVHFSEWGVRDAENSLIGANYECRLVIRGVIVFRLEMEQEQLVVSTINYYGLERKSLCFRLSEIDDDWLDQLGHYILRKSDRLGRLEIAPDMREQIQQQLERENLIRQQELERAARLAAQEQEEEDPKLARMFKHLRKQFIP